MTLSLKNNIIAELNDIKAVFCENSVENFNHCIDVCKSSRSGLLCFFLNFIKVLLEPVHYFSEKRSQVNWTIDKIWINLKLGRFFRHIIERKKITQRLMSLCQNFQVFYWLLFVVLLQLRYVVTEKICFQNVHSNNINILLVWNAYLLYVYNFAY